MSYGYPGILPDTTAAVALGWLGLSPDHALRVDVEVLIAERCGWGAIKRYAMLHGTPERKMSLKITAKNFRGLRHAEVTADPLILATGTNAQGKSSLAQAVAACLTGRAIEESFELRKADIKMLVRDGSTVATIDIVNAEGSAKMTYPDAKLQTFGDAPRASLFAAGLASIPTLPAKERAAALAPYMKATPTYEDLRAAAAANGFEDKAAQQCWAAIERDGWDGVLKSVEDRRAQSRATWEQVTGESFGSQKAQTWLPDGWQNDLLGDITVEALTDAVEQARAAVDAAVGGRAVEVHDIERARALADDGALRLQQLDEAKNAVEALKREKASVEEQKYKAPAPHNFAPLECPHCGGKIRLASVPNRPYGEKLEKAVEIPEEENKRRRTLTAELDGKLSNVQGRLAAAQRNLTIAEERCAESTAMRDKLAADAGIDENAATEEEAARSRLREAETNLIRFKRKTEAEQAYRRWDANDKFAKVLSNGPDGLRAKKLAEATLLFNSQILAPVCQAAQWGKVEITEDFRVTLDGRVFPLLSDSDQLRVKIVLQVAMAKIDGSSMIVVDRAEALDGANKKKLFMMLLAQKINALVCMVPSGKIPDLKAAGIGETIIIDDGTAKPLAAGG